MRRAVAERVSDVHTFAVVYPVRAAATVFGALALTVLSAITLDRTFSVSCAPGAACVTLDELRSGAGLPEAVRIYDRDGAVFAEVAGPLRRTLRYEEMPELLVDAFVAVEDRRFWEHDGIDGRGIARAALRNVLGGDISEGASTIPMQLVRTIWAESLRDVGPWRRKIIEARTAPRLVEELGHERVLTLYLNAIYLGDGIYGVERASRHYFGMGVGELDIGQVAMLVGMTRAPELYDPRSHPERARSVRSTVLATLVEVGLTEPAEAAAAEEGGLGVAPRGLVPPTTTERTHVTAAVTRELRRVAPELAGTPGLGIHTTIDPVVQSLGEAAVLEQLARIEAGDHGPFATEDSVARLEAAALALDPTSGAVRAWIGGRDFKRSEFDRVDQARRQVGSLVKPFLVVTALERGYGIVDMVSADTVPIATDEGFWLPADHVPEIHLPLREALVRSSNRAAAQLGVGLGLETVPGMGRRVGISGSIPAVPSTSIGAFDASLLEMTAAYAIFGNGGYSVTPHLIQHVDGPDGTELWRRPEVAGPEQLISDVHAFVLLDAMRTVVERGTGTGVRRRGYRGPAAGKTGTTNDGRDAWFIGLTPDVVAGMWFGFDQPKEIVRGGGGGTLAAPAWGSWMEELSRSGAPRTGAWIPPEGVERVRYSATTGEVISLACRDRVTTETHYEAWVESGRYVRASCSEGVRGWLGRLWRTIVPGTEPDPPAGRRPGGR